MVKCGILCVYPVWNLLSFPDLEDFQPLFLRLIFPLPHSFWDFSYTNVRLLGISYNLPRLCVFFLFNFLVYILENFLLLYIQINWFSSSVFNVFILSKEIPFWILHFSFLEVPFGSFWLFVWFSMSLLTFMFLLTSLNICSKLIIVMLIYFFLCYSLWISVSVFTDNFFRLWVTFSVSLHS